MAGFDLDFGFQRAEEELVRVLLRAAQRRAIAADVRLHFRRESDTRYHVSLDGSLLNIEPLVLLLMRELPGVAEGFADSTLRWRRRRRLVIRFLNAVANALEQFLAQHLEVAERLHAVPVAVTVDVGGRTHLAGRMRLFRVTVSMYLAGQLDPETMLEEAHTTVETLLREMLGGPAGGGTFAQLVEGARAAGALDAHLAGEMIRLKDLRKGVKHEGRGVSQARMDDLIHPTLAACQRMAAVLRQGRPPGRSIVT